MCKWTPALPWRRPKSLCLNSNFLHSLGHLKGDFFLLLIECYRFKCRLVRGRPEASLSAGSPPRLNPASSTWGHQWVTKGREQSRATTHALSGHCIATTIVYPLSRQPSELPTRRNPFYSPSPTPSISYFRPAMEIDLPKPLCFSPRKSVGTIPT